MISNHICDILCCYTKSQKCVSSFVITFKHAWSRTINDLYSHFDNINGKINFSKRQKSWITSAKRCNEKEEIVSFTSSFPGADAKRKIGENGFLFYFLFLISREERMLKCYIWNGRWKIDNGCRECGNATLRWAELVREWHLAFHA